MLQFSSSSSPDTPRSEVVPQSRQFSSSSSADTPRTEVALQSRQRVARTAGRSHSRLYFAHSTRLDVFGCELELLNLQNQQPLPEAFRTVLLQRPQLQIVVRLCMVDGHSIWQFQDDGKESYPKAVRVPSNPRGAVPDRAFYAAPSLRHVEVTTGIRHVGAAAWQACQQQQIVKLPPSVISLAEGAFLGCYVLREVVAPGCIRFGPLFPRVRTPCGHGAQVIVEGREEQTDGGERNKDPKPTQTKHPSPQAETPPSCSLSSTLGETCETETSGN